MEYSPRSPTSKMRIFSSAPYRLMPARARRACGLPNAMLRSPEQSNVRFYDLLSNAPVKLNVAERRAFPDDLPVDDVIGVGWGGYAPLPMPR
jgi:hypothetical protein